MITYEIYCDSCETDYEVSVRSKKEVKQCSFCGSELDGSSVAESEKEYDTDDLDDEWGWEED